MLSGSCESWALQKTENERLRPLEHLFAHSCIPRCCSPWPHSLQDALLDRSSASLAAHGKADVVSEKKGQAGYSGLFGKIPAAGVISSFKNEGENRNKCRNSF